jgi:hypothetical protein
MTAPTSKFLGWAPQPGRDRKDGHVHLAITEFEPKVWDDDDVEGRSKDLAGASVSCTKADIPPSQSIVLRYVRERPPYSFGGLGSTLR